MDDEIEDGDEEENVNAALNSSVTSSTSSSTADVELGAALATDNSVQTGVVGGGVGGGDGRSANTVVNNSVTSPDGSRPAVVEIEAALATDNSVQTGGVGGGVGGGDGRSANTVLNNSVTSPDGSGPTVVEIEAALATYNSVQTGGVGGGDGRSANTVLNNSVTSPDGSRPAVVEIEAALATDNSVQTGGVGGGVGGGDGRSANTVLNNSVTSSNGSSHIVVELGATLNSAQSGGVGGGDGNVVEPGAALANDNSVQRGAGGGGGDGRNTNTALNSSVARPAVGQFVVSETGGIGVGFTVFLRNLTSDHLDKSQAATKKGRHLTSQYDVIYRFPCVDDLLMIASIVPQCDWLNQYRSSLFGNSFWDFLGNCEQCIYRVVNVAEDKVSLRFCMFAFVPNDPSCTKPSLNWPGPSEDFIISMTPEFPIFFSPLDQLLGKCHDILQPPLAVVDMEVELGSVQSAVVVVNSLATDVNAVGQFAVNETGGVGSGFNVFLSSLRVENFNLSALSNDDDLELTLKYEVVHHFPLVGELMMIAGLRPPQNWSTQDGDRCQFWSSLKLCEQCIYTVVAVSDDKVLLRFCMFASANSNLDWPDHSKDITIFMVADFPVFIAPINDLKKKCLSALGTITASHASVEMLAPLISSVTSSSSSSSSASHTHDSMVISTSGPYLHFHPLSIPFNGVDESICIVVPTGQSVASSIINSHAVVDGVVHAQKPVGLVKKSGKLKRKAEDIGLADRKDLGLTDNQVVDDDGGSICRFFNCKLKVKESPPCRECAVFYQPTPLMCGRHTTHSDHQAYFRMIARAPKAKKVNHVSRAAREPVCIIDLVQDEVSTDENVEEDGGVSEEEGMEVTGEEVDDPHAESLAVKYELDKLEAAFRKHHKGKVAFSTLNRNEIKAVFYCLIHLGFNHLHFKTFPPTKKLWRKTTGVAEIYSFMRSETFKNCGLFWFTDSKEFKLRSGEVRGLCPRRHPLQFRKFVKLYGLKHPKFTDDEDMVIDLLYIYRNADIIR